MRRKFQDVGITLSCSLRQRRRTRRTHGRCRKSIANEIPPTVFSLGKRLPDAIAVKKNFQVLFAADQNS